MEVFFPQVCDTGCMFSLVSHFLHPTNMQLVDILLTLTSFSFFFVKYFSVLCQFDFPTARTLDYDQSVVSGQTIRDARELFIDLYRDVKNTELNQA